MFCGHYAKATLAGAVLALLVVTSARAQEVPTYHVTDLGPMIEELFPGVTYPSSDARGLNENGDLVGESPISNDGHQRAWIYTVEHGIVPLPVLPGDTRGKVRDVSDRDANGEVMIVGGSTYVVERWTAVLWRFSTVTGEVLETRSIGIPPGFDESNAVAVNNDGIVVGSTYSIGPYTNWKYDVATDVLETFDFPWRVTDLNNVGQVCGGSYRGDLFGNYEDLTDIYEPGDVMPDWAIENGGISAGWSRINDLGWLVGRAGTGISDGAGHYHVAIVRFADPIGWTGMPAVSHLSMAGGINDSGDFTSQSKVYLEDQAQTYYIGALVSPQFPFYDPDRTAEINNNGQMASWSGHVILLTPLGVMIIPGDVNGDVAVDRDDYCAWLAAPIDLNGDGLADAEDEQWLIERLLVFGWTLEDCNANGAVDHCDILDALSADCDENDVPDECQPDCNADGFPDVCEPDCNANGMPDPCDILDLFSMDCNANGIPDECDQGESVTEALNVFDPPVLILVDNVFVDDLLVTGVGTVADVDLTIDIHYRIGELTILLSHGGVTITICDRPGVPGDEPQANSQYGYDITVDDEGAGDYLENVGNFGQPVEQIVSPPSYKPDEPLSAFDGLPAEGLWTLTVTTSQYWTPPVNTFDDWGLIVTLGSAPVSCDCNGNGVADLQDIAAGSSADCDGNVVPDECELAANDCNGSGTLDACDTADGTSLDCNNNAIPDECEGDCNGSGIPDDCDVAAGTSADCDGNGVPDECDVLANDCNGNGTVDACDVLSGISGDCNLNSVPDECESGLNCDNDWCIDALAICPGSGNGSTAGADRDGDAACDAYHKSPDVWYAYTPGTDGQATASTCDAPYNTLISVHSGCPGDQSNELACNDNACGDNDASVTWSVTAGETYLVRVAGYLNSSGGFTLTLDGPECGPVASTCVAAADCADPSGSGARADGCMWWSCAAGECVGTEVVFADLGGPFGACAPDGVADSNDRFHALNCFANSDPNNPGAPYGCEDAPPAAFNVDAGGPFGACAPDGVCDGNDAFHALDAFEGAALCACPLDGPAPVFDPAPKKRQSAAVTLLAERARVSAGEHVAVDVIFDNPVDDLRGYQLHIGVAGGDRGRLELVDMVIHERKDHVFAGQPAWSAFNVRTAQLVAGLDTDGVSTPADGYLATLIFQAGPDAAGTFVVDLLHDDHDPAQRTFLFATPANGKIEIDGTTPAVIEVHTAARKDPGVARRSR